MEGLRDELLPGPILPHHEDPGIGGSDPLYAFHDPTDLEGGTDDFMPALHLASETLDAGRESLHLERVSERQQDAIGVERLFEEVVGTPPRRLHGGVDRAMTADHHHQGTRILLPQPRENVQAVHPGHLHVEKDHIDG